MWTNALLKQAEDQYDVYIHKAYFPEEIRPKGIGKEDFEQWKVTANSRQEAAEKIWAKHGDRLIDLMIPHESQLPRKVSLYVSDPRTKTPPGRLQPILVYKGWRGCTHKWSAARWENKNPARKKILDADEAALKQNGWKFSYDFPDDFHHFVKKEGDKRYLLIVSDLGQWSLHLIKGGRAGNEELEYIGGSHTTGYHSWVRKEFGTKSVSQIIAEMGKA